MSLLPATKTGTSPPVAGCTPVPTTAGNIWPALNLFRTLSLIFRIASLEGPTIMTIRPDNYPTRGLDFWPVNPSSHNGILAALKINFYQNATNTTKSMYATP